MGKRLLLLLMGLLFAIMFSLGGWVAGWAPLLKTYSAWQSTRDWVEVAATVLDSELQPVRGSKSTTYALQAHYEYEFEGRRHIGQRIGLFDTQDNFDDWHQRWQATLSRARIEARPISAWVNPQAPEEAVLEREVRWKTVAFCLPFAMLFPLAAIVGVYIFWRALRQPAQPMLPATNARVVAPVRGGHLFLFVFGLAFVIMGGSFGLLAIPPGFKPHVSWLVLIFPLVGLLICYLGIRGYFASKHLGEITLQLDELQPQLGGVLNGVLTFATPPMGPHHVSLICENVNKVGESNSYRSLWVQEAPLRIIGKTARIRFALPDNLPPSEPEALVYNHWKLQVQSAAMSDPAEFPLLVYPGNDSGQPAAEPALQSAQDVHTVDIPAAVASVEEGRKHLRIVYAADRSRSEALPIAILSLLFFGGAWLLFTLARVIPLGIFVGLIGAVILYASLRCLKDGLSIEIRDGTLQIVRSTLFSTRHQEMPANDIVRLLAMADNRMRHGADPTLHEYTIYGATREGNAVVLGNAVPDARVATSLMTRLQPHLAPETSIADVRQLESNRLELARLPKRNLHWAVRNASGIVITLALLAFVGSAASWFAPHFTEDNRSRIEASADAWFSAMDADRLDDLKAIAAQGFPIDTQADNGSSALALAATKGHLPIAQWLVEAGADIQQRNNQPKNSNYQTTPLMRAGFGGNPDVMRLLLDRGARVNDRDAVQRTPLHFAAWGGCSECIRLLLDRGASLDAHASGGRGETPLMSAAGNGKLEAVKTLLELGADLKAKDSHGYDAIGWAEFHQQAAMVDYLRSLPR